MSLKVIGAGLPRTGTTSLKRTLEQLLGGRCYHMFELFNRVEDHGMGWWAALHGEHDRLDELLDGWVAAVDWPTSILWRELADRHPDALIVLSHRGDAGTWWQSANATVWEAMRRTAAGDHEIFKEFNRTMLNAAGFPADLDDADGAKARYDQHFAEVVDAIPGDRLLLWQPNDGFGPIAERLGVDAPDIEPLHENTGDEFRARMAAAADRDDRERDA